MLLAAYRAWGREALQKLNGMFSFAIWDAKENMLFAARDHLGVKPFYYHFRDGAFSFASEIKALLALGIPARPNDQLIYEYLAHGYYDHRPETWFDGITKLPAGHFLMLRGGSLTIKKYWDLADIAREPTPLALLAAKEQFLALLSDAIRLRFRSDVSVGLNLSSGLDSAALLHFADRHYQKPLTLFSMRSALPEFDEGALIEPQLSQEQKKRWHTSTLPERIGLAELAEHLAVEDEPYGGIPTLAYARLAALEKERGVTVILEGQGGDELLAGYRYYRPEHLAKDAGGRSQDASIEINTSALEEGFVARHAGSAWCAQTPFSSPLLNAQYRDLMHTKLPRVLRFNDRLSMAASREYRQPFLDYRLAEFCFFLPDDLKIREGVHKFLLREAMRGIVPPEVGARGKKTFGALQTPWFRSLLRGPIEELLRSPSFQSRPYFDHAKAAAAANRFFAGEGDNSFFLWQWVNLELWFRAFIDTP